MSRFNRTPQPTVTVIVPTYNEASVIEQKLTNITQGTYPVIRLEFDRRRQRLLGRYSQHRQQFLELNRLNATGD